MISQTELKRLQQRDDELGQWHATFPGRTPEDVLKLLAEGERRGRIAGLREAAAICSRLGLSPDARVALNDEANRLEKEQRKSISSDTPETKTKQER